MNGLYGLPLARPPRPLRGASSSGNGGGNTGLIIAGVAAAIGVGVAVFASRGERGSPPRGLHGGKDCHCGR